jgi:hypothetical protein
MNRRLIATALPALVGLACARGEPPRVAVATAAATAASSEPRLSPTRLLRRVHLTLRGREPTAAAYDEAKRAAAEGRLDALIAAQVESILASTEFYDRMVEWGHDYLRVGDYTRGSTEGGTSAHFKGSHSVKLDPCKAGTMHAGALGHFGTGARQDPSSLCDDAAAPVATVEPWWAPGTQVRAIGRAGNGARKGTGGGDCGVIAMGDSDTNYRDDPPCGCGPNLVYCALRPVYGMLSYEQDASPYYEDSARRLLFEEPARLFAHVVTADAPFSDLVIGSYTVAPRKLQHVYVRWGRMNSENAAQDDSSWWRKATDGWDRVEVSTLHPNLLSERDYKFDPRSGAGYPRGIPVAGVLTQLGPNVTFPRERVRAARWLETFACRDFTAPDPAMVFMPPYTNDPARGGSCQHCHTAIDPAAIHFKRLEVEDDTPRHGVGFANFGGIGDWAWRRTFQASFADAKSPGGVFWFQPYGRWNANFIPDTLLTPSTAAQVAANPDTRFIDFLPPGERLFGLESDGTVGPLGFGKLLERSGELDRCAVARTFERFMGRPLDLTREAAAHTAMVADFKANGRKVKALIRSIVASDEFRRGL